MPAEGPPSEFGGKVLPGTGGVQPPPHELTASEELVLVYREDDGLGWHGLMPLEGEDG